MPINYQLPDFLNFIILELFILCIVLVILLYIDRLRTLCFLNSFVKLRVDSISMIVQYKGQYRIDTYKYITIILLVTSDVNFNKIYILEPEYFSRSLF